jgi:hypothetical protein
MRREPPSFSFAARGEVCCEAAPCAGRAPCAAGVRRAPCAVRRHKKMLCTRRPDPKLCNWVRTRTRGGLPNSLGCSLDRFPFASRKCHQMSSKEHMQLGWVVCLSVLSTSPGHPTAGRCGRVVVVLPLLLYSPCASSAFGWGSKPPSRSALAPVGSSPGLVLSPVTALQFSRLASLKQLLPNRNQYE